MVAPVARPGMAVDSGARCGRLTASAIGAPGRRRFGLSGTSLGGPVGCRPLAEASERSGCPEAARFVWARTPNAPCRCVPSVSLPRLPASPSTSTRPTTTERRRTRHDVSLIGRLTRDAEPVASRIGTALANPRLRLAVDRRTGQAVFESAKSSDAHARTRHPADGRQLAISGRLGLNQLNTHDANMLPQPNVTAQTAQLLAGKPTAEHHDQPATADRAER